MMAMLAAAISVIVLSRANPPSQVQQERITLPPKPLLVRQADYGQVYRYANLGEKGNIAWSIVGLKSMIFENGVSFAIDKSFVSNFSVSEVEDALKKSIESWNSRLGVNALKISQSVREADIKVKLLPTLSTGFESTCLGRANYTRSVNASPFAPNYSIQGTIEIVRNHQGRKLSLPELNSVMMHEIGHVLGLDDVATPVGVMGTFELGRPRLEPSRQELESLSIYRTIINAVIERVSGTGKTDNGL